MVCPRLVRFIASAFDTRYAFVAALGPDRPAEALRPMTLWLTRDFGLTVEWAEGLVRETFGSTADLECLPALRQLRPHDGGLAALDKGTCVTVALRDPEGRVLGLMGLGDPGPSWRFLARERLLPLARLAEAELLSQRAARQPESSSSALGLGA